MFLFIEDIFIPVNIQGFSKSLVCIFILLEGKVSEIVQNVNMKLLWVSFASWWVLMVS